MKKTCKKSTVNLIGNYSYAAAA